MRSLVPPRGDWARARCRTGDSPRAGLAPRERFLVRVRLRAGAASSAGTVPSAMVLVGSLIVPRLVLLQRNLLDDRLVAILNLSLDDILTGRQVGSEYLAAARPSAGGVGAAEPRDGGADTVPGLAQGAARSSGRPGWSGCQA